MMEGTQRQIRLEGCMKGRPLRPGDLYAFASTGSLSKDLRFKPDPAPSWVSINVGDPSGVVGKASLVVIPNWGVYLTWLTFVIKHVTRRRRKPKRPWLRRAGTPWRRPRPIARGPGPNRSGRMLGECPMVR
jgi:hypothetical protein